MEHPSRTRANRYSIYNKIEILYKKTFYYIILVFINQRRIRFRNCVTSVTAAGNLSYLTEKIFFIWVQSLNKVFKTKNFIIK